MKCMKENIRKEVWCAEVRKLNNVHKVSKRMCLLCVCLCESNKKEFGRVDARISPLKDPLSEASSLMH